MVGGGFMGCSRLHANINQEEGTKMGASNDISNFKEIYDNVMKNVQTSKRYSLTIKNTQMLYLQ